MKQADTATSTKKLLFQFYQMQLHEALSGNFIINFNSVLE